MKKGVDRKEINDKENENVSGKKIEIEAIEEKKEEEKNKS